MKWDTLKIDDQFYWSWIFIVSDFISRIFHQYWCQNWRPIPLVMDFHSIRFHFTNFFHGFSKDQWKFVFMVAITKNEYNEFLIPQSFIPSSSKTQAFPILSACPRILEKVFETSPKKSHFATLNFRAKNQHKNILVQFLKIGGKIKYWKKISDQNNYFSWHENETHFC